MAGRGSWADLPEQPHRYRLIDRWGDYRAGRADGRKPIPEVISEHPDAPAEAGDDSPAADDLDQVRPAIDAAPTKVPVPPYLHGLRHARNEILQIVAKAWRKDTGVAFHEKVREAESRYQDLAIKKDLAQSRLDKVSGDLTDEELNHRRTAERDERKWLAEMVRDRRKRESDLARAKEEDALHEAAAELRVAEVELKYARLTLGEQLKAARATGWQVVHHYARREAAYLRALARKHPNGPELVKLLELTGPDMPEWLLADDADGKDDAEREEGGGS